MTKDRRSPDSEISGTASPPKRSAGEAWRERSRGQSEGDKRRAKRTQEANRALSGEIGTDKNDVRRRGNVFESLFEEEFERQKAAKSPAISKPKPLPAHLFAPSVVVRQPIHDKIAKQSDASKMARVPGTLEQKDEGRLNEPLLRYLKAKKIPPEMWSDTAAEIEGVVRKKLAAAVKRPQWDDRAKYPELQFLPAPAFLKRVWADQISPTGEIEKDMVRRQDRSLMIAVEGYIKNRQRREIDAGAAQGLKLIARGYGGRKPNAPSQ